MKITFSGVVNSKFNHIAFKLSYNKIGYKNKGRGFKIKTREILLFVNRLFLKR